MLQSLSNCQLCPHCCQVNRLAGEIGQCGGSDSIKLALASLHHWEEPCISGDQGSGTIFFSGCNLHCVYCQNHEISQELKGKTVSVDQLVEILLNQQKKGAHNINLVSPTPYIPLIAAALKIAKAQGLHIPIIYNTSSYENVHSLHALEGLIDIYLPDLKYADHQLSVNYSGAPKYFYHATRAILEMYRQVGSPCFNKNGLLESGLMIRHLILPGQLDNTQRILDWIKENLPLDVFISLMGQYVPLYHADQFTEINRVLTEKEYNQAIDYFFAIGLENGYVQELDAASSDYVPNFDFSGI